MLFIGFYLPDSVITWNLVLIFYLLIRWLVLIGRTTMVSHIKRQHPEYDEAAIGQEDQEPNSDADPEYVPDLEIPMSPELLGSPPPLSTSRQVPIPKAVDSYAALPPTHHLLIQLRRSQSRLENQKSKYQEQLNHSRPHEKQYKTL